MRFTHVWVCLSIGLILSLSRLGLQGQNGAERTESSLRSPAPPASVHSPTALGTSCPRGVCWAQPKYMETSVSVRVNHPPPESSICPRLHAWHCPFCRFVSNLPGARGIFPDQGSIENILSPASWASGFLTTRPQGREIPSQPSKIIYPETLNVILQIIGPSQLK